MVQMLIRLSGNRLNIVPADGYSADNIHCLILYVVVLNGRIFCRPDQGREIYLTCSQRHIIIRWSTSRERSEEHTSELQSRGHLVCRLLLEKKKSSTTNKDNHTLAPTLEVILLQTC